MKTRIIIGILTLFAGLFLAIGTEDGSNYETGLRFAGLCLCVLGVLIGGFADNPDKIMDAETAKQRFSDLCDSNSDEDDEFKDDPYIFE